jgi:hypothetical protein
VSTIYLWCKEHKQFSEAKKIGEAQSLLFFERLGRSGFVKEGFNNTLWIFQMKCRFNKYGWNPEGQNISFPGDEDEDGFEFI